MTPARHYTIRTKKRRIKTGRLFFLLAICAFLFTILFSVRLFSTLSAIQDTAEWVKKLPVPAPGEREHILLYSVSDSGQNALVTGLVLASYKAGEKINAILIPADTLIEVDGIGFMRLSQVYAHGQKEALIKAVSKFLSVSIHSFLEINENFLPLAIDKTGPLTMSAGRSIQNGKDVLSLLHAEGLTPEEQLEYRRELLSAIGGRVVSGNAVAKLRTFYQVSPLISTSLSWRKLLSTTEMYKSSSYPDSVSLWPLAGKEEVQSDGSYWLADTEAIPIMVMMLKGETANLTREQVRVEVLNGSGTRGVAATVSDRLRKENYHVVRAGNADRFDYETTQVVFSSAGMEVAKEIAAMITGAQLVKQELDPGVHVRVIIGKNYK